LKVLEIELRDFSSEPVGTAESRTGISIQQTAWSCRQTS
jgi:hypothetical protein